VLARDIAFFERDVLVVTADNELMSRCRTAIWRKNNKDGNAGDDGDNKGGGTGTGGLEIQFVHPLSFICDLEAAMAKEMLNSNIDDTTTAATGSNSIAPTDPKQQQQQQPPVYEKIDINEKLFDTIDEEIKIRGTMYETEVQMRQKRNMNTPKKRRKLEKRARMLCERMAMKGGQNIDHITSVPTTVGSPVDAIADAGAGADGGASSITKYDRRFQDEVLKQWEELRRTATRKEMTGDRMLLAEYFRRQIEDRVNTIVDYANDTTNDTTNGDTDHDESGITTKKNVEDYVHHLNDATGNRGVTALSPSAVSSPTDDTTTYQTPSSSTTHRPLRLVIISDTHGYEEQLTPNGTTLPPGDVLLHLGDFAIDGSIKMKAKAIARFDAWLSLQPHRTKIVLRGNHDPFRTNLPLSGAAFYSRPNGVAIDGGRLALALVPYCSPRILSSSWRKMPMFADVMASHSPPAGVLDKCYNGSNAGCATLRGKVEKMIAGPPRLWVCGHIHEGRGVKKQAFGFTGKETLVVNAANANCGRATRIVHGPIVVDIDGENEIVIVEQESKAENTVESKDVKVEQESEIGSRVV